MDIICSLVNRLTLECFSKGGGTLGVVEVCYGERQPQMHVISVIKKERGVGWSG